MRLRLGIQSKLVITLVLAGLLPLLLSLVVLLIAVFRLRVTSVGQSFQAFARQDADNLGTLLSAQVELAQVFSQLPGTVELLNAANRTPPSTADEIARIEATWANLPETDPLLREVLHNRVADQWQSVREHRMRFAEVMVTDAAGRLIAATNKTSDYFQADEDWWQQTRQAPFERVRLEDARWDSSAQSLAGSVGLLVVNVCIPLVDPSDQSFLGAMKVSLDVAWLLDHLQSLSRPSDIEVTIALISGSGTRLKHAQPTTAPLNAKTPPHALFISPAAVPRLKSQRTGWITQKSFGDDVLGFARVDLPPDRVAVDHNLDWYVVIAASRSAALQPLYRLTSLILAAGLLTIAGCFVIGLYVARREIIRPLLALQHGVNEFGRGNIDYRLSLDRPSRTFRADEIGEVARAFNQMADELRATVQRLEQTGLLKQQFIDVASHELRTPVTYILGVAQLAERQAETAGTENPLASKVSAKARRLGRIVDNMMKLLKDDSFETALHLGMVDLRSIIETTHQEVAPFLTERSQRCVIDISDDLPAIRGDAEKLKDVMLNLLSNAIRFSPDESTIHIEARKDGDFVDIDVTDEGEGIAEQDLPHIFEPFRPQTRDDVMRHTSGEYAYNTRGLGLGLSVVKRFVDLHGGIITVHTSGAGTRMRVRLPVHLEDRN